MKDSKDTFTLDLADMSQVRRQRGRPSTGQAMTGAERQAARRERLKAAGKAPLSVVIDADLLDRLHEFVEFKDMTIAEVVNRVLRDRLLRKR